MGGLIIGVIGLIIYTLLLSFKQLKQPTNNRQPTTTKADPQRERDIRKIMNYLQCDRERAEQILDNDNKLTGQSQK